MTRRDWLEKQQKHFASQQRGKWKTEKGLPIRSWKTVANKWIWMYQLASRPKP
ncbi:hypothetical protein LWM68_08085 [Niabella sp. W65]|nr:hypothetical protein [Niabella sp. W65]MCH7362726.1 hypothetical protein [Niabella sp. W65]